MWGATLGLVSVTVALTVSAGPLTGLTTTEARALLQPDVCVTAVLVKDEQEPSGGEPGVVGSVEPRGTP